jgi:hypothetical protein
MLILLLVAFGGLTLWAVARRDRRKVPLAATPLKTITGLDDLGPPDGEMEFGAGWTKYHFPRAYDRTRRALTPLHVPSAGPHHHRQEILDFTGGRDRSLEVERQPDNPHDSNALAVIGVWTQGAEIRRRELLGFVPRNTAAVIHTQRATDTPIWAEPVSVFGRDDWLEMKVELLEPSVASGFWGANAPNKCIG